MEEKPQKLSPLEEGILIALRALDNQILREVSKRSPADRDDQGVQKWEPIDTRVENVCSYVLNLLGEDVVKLDSLLVFAQAFPKILQMVVAELGEEGLGKVRSQYCIEALKRIAEDARRGSDNISTAAELM